MRQIYPEPADLGRDGLAACYAYPDLPVAGREGGLRWWLRANMVTSLDGAATVGGRSGGLSGGADQDVFALLRALADVIIVGAGTARAERYGPVRPGQEGVQWAWLRDGRPAAPPIAVVTRQLSIDPASRLLAQLIEAGLVDELCLTISPLLTGPGAARIVAGTGPLPGGARPVTLAHVLVQDGHLLCRYTRPPA